MNSNRIMLTAIVAAAFVSGCSSTSTLITYDCQKEDECEREAERMCKTKNFRVSERAKYEEANQPPLWERTSASDITGALGQGMGGSKRYATDDDKRPRWRYTVECNPRTPDPVRTESTTTIYPEMSAEQLAKREKYKKMYMHEVCELTDPDLRREELEMARREFGDVSCPD